MKLFKRLRNPDARADAALDAIGMPALVDAAILERPADFCTATTTRGARCKLPSNPGTGRCVFHQAK